MAGRKGGKPAASGRRRVRRPAAQRSARTIETALAGFAHDIRTPLTGILALSDLLATADLGERERGWATALKSAAEHLTALTSLVADAAKASGAGLVLRQETFSPRGLAETAGASLIARAAAKGIDASLAVGPEVPAHAIGDAVRLRGALENLIDNAIKFTDRGSVRLDLAADTAAAGRLRLTFSLSDTGIGLSPAEIRRLFRPFAQANPEIGRRYGGTGLGLVAVRRLARAMGGDLVVDSVAGQGSTFRLTVTVQPAPATTASGTDADNSGAHAGFRILCAEDNPYGRVVLNTMLTELGHAVAFVGSGEAAIEAAAGGNFDIVLMDIALAGLDGLTAARRIRDLPPPAGRVPIIGISGHGETGHETAAREAGMTAYLRKPVSPAGLAAALAQARA